MPRAPKSTLKRNGARAADKKAARARRSKFFTEKQLHLLEQLMLDEYARIIRVARDLADEIILRAERCQTGGDAGDLSSGREMREANSFVLDRSASETRDLASALTRLRTSPDTFGLCRSCEKPIAIERLEIVPTTTSCSQHAN